MNDLSKIKNTLNKTSEELSSKLLFYNEFIDINSYKVEIINSLNDEDIEIDCSNNIIYIDKDAINSTSFKSLLKHKLLRAYLYHITDIELKRLSLDTSYLFILYSLATDTDPGYTAKNTLYYDFALEVESLIKNNPYLIDLIYFNINKKETKILDDLNKLAETEWFRINRCDYSFNKKYKYSVIETVKLVNNIINLIYQVDFFDLKHDLFSNMTTKENA